MNILLYDYYLFLFYYTKGIFVAIIVYNLYYCIIII